MHKRIKWAAAAIVGGSFLMPISPLGAAEFGDNTPYYEDDAWYDVTEWLDGNDYNPTDEAWWRWDNETYQASEDVSGDTDRERNYGYATGRTNDWFYDYYTPHTHIYTYPSADPSGAASSAGAKDPGTDSAQDAPQQQQAKQSDAAQTAGAKDSPDKSGRGAGKQADGSASSGDGGASVTTAWYDYDDDRMYDAFTVSNDTDGDGRLDDVSYYFFSDAGKSGAQKQQQEQQGGKDSSAQGLSGKIQNLKEVQVRGAKHTVVQIASKDQQDQSVIADLGKTDAIKGLNLKQGDQITVRGPKSKVGDKKVILANSLEAGGQTKQIDRQARQIEGKVLSTHKAKIRGSEHLIAMVEVQPTAPQQKQQGVKAGKVAVDLGPAEALQADVSKGSQITFTGMPVKVKDKRLIVAQSVKQGEQFVQIDRQQAQGGEAQPASATEKATDADKQGNQGSQQPQEQKQPGQQ